MEVGEQLLRLGADSNGEVKVILSSSAACSAALNSSGQAGKR